jgi:hypothetical protein
LEQEQGMTTVFFTVRYRFTVGGSGNWNNGRRTSCRVYIVLHLLTVELTQESEKAATQVDVSTRRAVFNVSFMDYSDPIICYSGKKKSLTSGWGRDKPIRVSSR